VRQVYEIGGAATSTSGLEERAEIYGQFLSTCADCHRITEARIGMER